MEKLMLNVAQELRGSKVVYQFQEEAPKLSLPKDWVGATFALLGVLGDFKIGAKYKITVSEVENG